jgi:RNA polymerase sigma factor for flagellar operon FliA
MNSASLKDDTRDSAASLAYSKRMKDAALKYREAMSTKESRDQLIEDYLPLVKSIVSRMRSHFPDHYEVEDIYGVGVKALVVSVNQFNPSKGKSFGNYASLRIKGSLIDELRKMDSLPRANRAKAKSLQATISDMESRLMRPVSIDEVKAELNLNESEYSKLLKQTQPVTFVPIDEPAGVSHGDGDLIPLSETISDPTEQDASEQTEHRERVYLLRDKIKDLPDPQKKILMLYYYEELKLSEIAHIFGLSEGRISQILSHSVLSLRSHFQSLK